MIGQLGMGGTEKQVVLLARGLRERGIDTSVWALFGGPETCSGQALRRDGIRLVDVGLHAIRELSQALPNFSRLGGMTMRLRRERPDIVHAFLFHSAISPARQSPGWPGFRYSWPVVAASGTSRRIAAVALAAERLTTRFTDLIIANAVAVAEDTKRRERVGDDKVEVVYNGLPEQAFAPVSPAMVETAHPVVLCVANLKAVQGAPVPAGGYEPPANRRSPVHASSWSGRARNASPGAPGGRLRIDVRFLGECRDRAAPARASRRRRASFAGRRDEQRRDGSDGSRAAHRRHRVGGTPELLPGVACSCLPPIRPRWRRRSGGSWTITAWRHGSARRPGAGAATTCSAEPMVGPAVRIYSELLERRCAA